MIAHDVHLRIGSLLFEGVDQIDLTGPFEVLSRIPNSTYRIYAKTMEPVRDLKGLRLTPDATLAEAPPLDVLHVPGEIGRASRRERVYRSVPGGSGAGDQGQRHASRPRSNLGASLR